MLIDLAQRLADCREISSERLEAIASYLDRRLQREREEERPISIIAYETMWMVQATLRIRDRKH
jgi:hypothetical protein